VRVHLFSQALHDLYSWTPAIALVGLGIRFAKTFSGFNRRQLSENLKVSSIETRKMKRPQVLKPQGGSRKVADSGQWRLKLEDSALCHHNFQCPADSRVHGRGGVWDCRANFSPRAVRDT